jgi:hypothetical protein
MMGQYLVQSDGWHTRIAVFCKAVRQHLKHGLLGLRVGIDIDLAKLAIRPYIVHSTHVVVMRMGDEDAVNLPEGLRQNLLSEIRATVYEQASGIALHQCRTAQALVLGVLALTHLALATDDWHTARGPCT